MKIANQLDFASQTSLKSSGNGEIVLNLAISWLTTTQTQLANHSAASASFKKNVQRKISFHFLCETARTQAPILNAGAITLVWCTARGRNFP